MTILFVCTGNTCRSAMGAAIMKRLLEERGIREDAVAVKSAGIYAVDGAPASKNAVEAAAAYGADLAMHKAVRLNEEMIKTADLVLTMTGAHKSQILKMIPKEEEKVFTLKEYAGMTDNGKTEGDMNIADPYGGDIDEYRKCAQEIVLALQGIVERIALTL